ncbi:MAG: NAD(P)H-binding protein [Phycisphaerales bacterium]|nr:NAD(P)H-binding protein [Phycisphaerales bacterium]
MSTHREQASNPGTQTVALTGATGFVGRYIVRELLARGHKVRALARDPQKAASVFGAERSRVEWIAGDACDASALGRLVAGAGVCVHLVGIIREVRGDSADRPQTFQRVHVGATRAIVDACRTAGVKRFLHMSALGAGPEGRAEYQKTKWEAERYVRRAFGDGTDLDWTIFRPGLIHGPDGEFVQLMHDLCTGDLPPYFFLPYFARKRLDSTMPGGRVDWIEPKVQPVAVEDVAAAFCEAIVRSDSVGEIYNLVGAEVLGWSQMLEFFRDTLPGTNKGLKPWFVPSDHAAMIATVAGALGLGRLLPFDKGQALMGAQDSTADTTKAAVQLGVKPRAFRDTVRGYASRV